MRKSTLSTTLMVLLIGGYLIEGSGAWFWSSIRRKAMVNRISATTPAPVCRRLCAFSCERQNKCGQLCCMNCSRFCDRKRDQNTEVIVPLPCKFSVWDRNADGGVDKNEFAKVAHARAKSLDVKYIFHSSDKNGDEVLSKEELNDAPLVTRC
ncbi:uncharacterized protein LOC125669796 [Ostrea edulis]|uniref:uncharacterized protein LOC125669796 n=1 Tax=Ostrea edulis TaxID=37623 RepID=UPI002095F438|nr:uncharacterized protein LOC125669796 [Ostrea edulis]XP_048760547.1 uncharacterized protein LOC125669796 [Ostrea edulis]